MTNFYRGAKPAELAEAMTQAAEELTRLTTENAELKARLGDADKAIEYLNNFVLIKTAKCKLCGFYTCRCEK